MLAGAAWGQHHNAERARLDALYAQELTFLLQRTSSRHAAEGKVAAVLHNCPA